MVGKPGKDFTITAKTGKKPIKRSQEREFALQVLFASELSGDEAKQQLSRLSSSGLIEATKFVDLLITLYVENKDEIDSYIVDQLKNWDFNRLALIDKIILRMAIMELVHMSDIPPEVSINEAIELAKKFSTEKSDKFINGILDAVFRKLKKENKISKSGRGLISKMQL